MHIKYRTSCRICGNTNLTHVIDLGYQHLQGCFVKDSIPKPSFRKTPNLLVRCDVSKNENACGLVQTAHTVPPEIMYANYWYQSGISNTMKKHLEDIVKLAMIKVPHPRNVLDIACNDGTLLNFYPSSVCSKCGIDPSDITANLRAKTLRELKEKLYIIHDFFPYSFSSSFDIITSIAMFYDLEDPNSFVKEISNKTLSIDGIWCLEVAYLPYILSRLCYDTIVSEHLEHYHLAPLEYLFRKNDLKLVDVYLNDTNGGSIQCWVAHKECNIFDNKEAKERISQIRMKEFDLALDTDKPYEMFRNRITVQKNELVSLLNELHQKGNSIHLYGASTKANTLLEYCEIGPEIISFASERSPEKWGAKTISGINIISEEESRKMKPNYYLVGPWHFKTEILEREKEIRKLGTKFIFPLPKVTIE